MSLLQKMAESVRNKFHPLHRLRRSRTYQNFIRPAFDFPVPARLGLRHPVSLRLLTHFSFLFLSNRMEAEALATFKTIVKHLHPSQDSFLDVGANIGLYSWHALDACPDLHVAAFEPDPRNVQLLKRTSQKWGVQNLIVHAQAASNALGTASFSQDLLSSATGSLEQSEPSFAEQHYGQRACNIRVATTTLDLATKDMPPPALVKIDVEGHEQAVLEGASELLERSRPILLIESFGERAEAVRNILNPLGYQYIDADSGQHTSAETMNHLCLDPARTDPALLRDLSQKNRIFETQ